VNVQCESFRHWDRIEGGMTLTVCLMHCALQSMRNRLAMLCGHMVGSPAPYHTSFKQQFYQEVC